MRNIFRIFNKRSGSLDGNFGLQLVSQMVIPTFVLGIDGSVLVWNDACEELTGLKAADVVGTKEHWRGFYAAPRACLADLVLSAGDGGTATYANVQIDTITGRGKAQNWCDLPCGRRRYLAIDAGMIRDSEGRAVAVVETLRDFTSEHQAVARLSEDQAEAKRLAAEEQKSVVRELAEGLHALAEGNLDFEISDVFPEKLSSAMSRGIHRRTFQSDHADHHGHR